MNQRNLVPVLVLLAMGASSLHAEEAVVWRRAEGVTITGSAVERAASTTGKSGAGSARFLTSGDGYARFIVSDVTTSKVVGLSTAPDLTTGSVRYGVLLGGDGSISIVENGTVQSASGTYTSGDEFKVAVESGAAVVRRNGTLIYTSSLALQYPLYAQVVTPDSGSDISSALISGTLGELVEWTNVTGPLATSPGSLIRLSGSGWDTGAVSTRALASGDGYMEFTVALPLNGQVSAGLGVSDSGPSYTDIEWGVYISSSASLQVRESGITRGTFGTVTNGDVMRLAVESGQVVYRKNGATFYTSTVSPSYPMVVDTALSGTGGSLGSVKFAGLLSDLATSRANASASGGIYASSQTVTLTTATAGATIRYTLDGTEPTTSSPNVSSGGTVTVSASAYLKAKAYASGLWPSATRTEYFSIGGASTTELAEWTNVTGDLATLPGSLTRISGLAWDTGAVSTRALASGDGYVEFTVSSTGTVSAGLGLSDSNTSYTDIEWCVYLGGPSLLVMESGVQRGTFGTVSTGDVIRVGAEGGQVVFRKNGNVFYTSAIAPIYPMVLDTAISAARGALSSAKLSGVLIDVATAPVSVSPPGGTYAASQTVTLTSATTGATIHYSTDGSAPTLSSPSVSSGGTVTVSSTCWLKSQAFSSGLWPSPVHSDFYFIPGPTTESVAWTNVIKAVTSGSTIMKIGVEDFVNNAGGVSTRAINSPDGYMEFLATSTFGGRSAGLSVGDSDQSKGDIDYSFALGSGGALQVFEAGANRGTFGTYAAGDVLRVAVEGGVVKYRKNGTLLYTSLVLPAYPLLVDTSIYNLGATVDSVVISGNLVTVGASQPVFNLAPADYATQQTVTVTDATPGATIYYTLNGVDPTTSDSAVASGSTVTVSTSATLKARAYASGLFPSNVKSSRYTIGLTGTTEPVTWTNMVGVTASTNTITKTSGTDFVFNAGGVSTRAIDSTDGYMEFKITTTQGLRTAGLSFGDTDQGYVDIDYAFYPTAGGDLHVFEAGADRGSVGTYAANDILRVAVENGVVKYRKNGTLLYTSLIPPSYPLMVDGSIYTMSKQINEAMISGHLTDSATPVPTFTPPGGTYDTALNVTLAGTPGSVIRYTTDGTNPTGTSTVYSGTPISVALNVPTTIKAFASAPGYLPGATASATYTFAAATPTITPNGGTFADSVMVTLATVTPNATIRYTLDGTDPTASSTAYSGPLGLTLPATLKAKTFHATLSPSPTASAAFSIYVTPPTITPVSGTYVSSVSVSMSGPSGASIYYTTDGADPTLSSTLYSGTPFTLTTSATVKAKAFASGLGSATTTASYTINVADPVFSPSTGRWLTQQTVVITTATPGASIRYTTDGTVPTVTSTLVGSGGAITVDHSMTVKAKAFLTGATPSNTRTGRYSVTGDIRAGFRFMVALKADKTVWAWGENTSGQLGRGDTASPQMTPIQVPGLSGIEAIAAGNSHALVLKSDGTVMAWGLNGNGQLGIGNQTNQSSPVAVPGLSGVKAIAAGNNFSLALLTNGEIWGWGDGTSGQLADGGFASRLSPVKSNYPTSPAPVQIVGGSLFSLVRFSDGTVKAAGGNGSGMLGNNSSTSSSSPVSVLLPAGVTDIFAGRGDSAFAVVTTGGATQMFAWGLNNFGQLGLGSTTSVLRTPLLLATGRTQAAVGYVGVIIAGYGAGLSSAGQGGQGELGVGPNPPGQLSRLAPIPGAPEVLRLTAGQQFSAALSITGTVWTWGSGEFGATGQGSAANVFAPKQIPSFSLVNNSAAAVDTDGDGLADGVEWDLGSDPELADTNGDGIDDGSALSLGQTVNSLDVDGDGLTAAQEAILGTNPFLADTDGDGVNDGLDAYPLDPTRSSSTPNPSDHTPPVITLLRPVSATLIP